jgi:hypothetical protein
MMSASVSAKPCPSRRHTFSRQGTGAEMPISAGTRWQDSGGRHCRRHSCGPVPPATLRSSPHPARGRGAGALGLNFTFMCRSWATAARSAVSCAANCSPLLTASYLPSCWLLSQQRFDLFCRIGEHVVLVQSPPPAYRSACARMAPSTTTSGRYGRYSSGRAATVPISANDSKNSRTRRFLFNSCSPSGRFGRISTLAAGYTADTGHD